jgi:hypothetical protein
MNAEKNFENGKTELLSEISIESLRLNQHVDDEFTVREGLLLNSYFFLKQLGQSDEKAFGLDKSDVEIEQVPLVYHRAEQVALTRINSEVKK